MFTTIERLLARTGVALPCQPAAWLVRGAGDAVGWRSAAAAERRLRGLCLAGRFGARGLRVDGGVRFEVPSNITIGDDVTLYGGSHYVAGRDGRLSIGDGTHVGRLAMISALGGVSIGRRCAIASGFTVYSNTNSVREMPEADVLDNPVEMAAVTIGDDVWAGANVTILPGVTVGDHAVLGAGSVVTKDVPEWSVVAGVPARRVKDRRADAFGGAPLKAAS